MALEKYVKVLFKANLMINDKFLILFIIILVYVLLLFLIQELEIGSKKDCVSCNNCCPDFNLALNRIKRLNRDKVAYHITFRIFDFKRYICNNCGWEGLKWERNYKPKEKN